jgi:GTP cyclohydrolase II
MDFIETWLAKTQTDRSKSKRPLVSLCYAQSLDGSLTAQPGEPTGLSGPESSILTHWLRAYHDAILVGIGTVKADNPRLTVRLVDGSHPQPIILDRLLETPHDSYLIRDHPSPTWIATSSQGIAKSRELEAFSNLRLLELPLDQKKHLSLTALLDCLSNLGIQRLMVEGGAKVITSFLVQRLVDQVILTIAPRYSGGLHIAEGFTKTEVNNQNRLLQPLKEVEYHRLGKDLIVLGRL